MEAPTMNADELKGYRRAWLEAADQLEKSAGAFKGRNDEVCDAVAASYEVCITLFRAKAEGKEKG